MLWRPKPPYSMYFERYAYRKKLTEKDYEFYSEGPKGRILKIVRFRLIEVDNEVGYNLSFGDWDEASGNVNYRVVSNNKDTEKVLATIVAIIQDFSAFFPERLIYVAGESEARARRYQMFISKTMDEIEQLFNVYGDTGEQWELFRKDAGYRAFFIIRKQHLHLQEPNDHYMSSSKKKDSRKKARSQGVHKFVIIDQPTCEAEARKMELARETFERIGLPKELMKNKAKLH